MSHDPRVPCPLWRDVTPLSGTETLPSCERQVVMRASVLYQTHHLSCVINRDMFFLASTIPPLSTTFMPSVQGYHRERLTSQGKNRGPVTQSALDEEGLKDEDKERAWEWNTETKWQPQVYVTTSTIPTWGRERISLTKGSCVRIFVIFPRPWSALLKVILFICSTSRFLVLMCKSVSCEATTQFYSSRLKTNVTVS